MVRDREAWHAAVHGVAKRWQDWATEEQHASLDLRFTLTPWTFNTFHLSGSQVLYLSTVLMYPLELMSSSLPESFPAFWSSISTFCSSILRMPFSLLPCSFTPSFLCFYSNYNLGILRHESEWKCCSVVSDSLWLHRLYIPCNSRGRILEWVAGPFSRGSPQPRDRTQVSHITGGFFTVWAMREGHLEASSMSYL